jgi:hypothetical protein
VVAKLTGTDDAHSTLRRLYLDEAQSPNTRVRAATAALNFERPRLESVPPALDVVSEEIEDLATLVAKRRKRQDELCPQSASDLPPIEVLPIADGRRSNGNGSGNST